MLIIIIIIINIVMSLRNTIRSELKIKCNYLFISIIFL